MPIPPLVSETGALPPGEHEASLDEVEDRFGSSSYVRRQLMIELRWLVKELRDRGADRIWIDGSFVTDKERPRDIDVVYRPGPGVNPATWNDILAPGRARDLKKRHKIELFKHPLQVWDRGRPQPIEEFFQIDRNDVPKGIVVLSDDEEESA